MSEAGENGGAEAEVENAETEIIVTIDGPAASGKSSTAKAVAAEIGYRHLDSGAFYRAVTLAAIRRGIPVESWPQLTDESLDSFAITSQRSNQGYDVFIEGVAAGPALRSAAVNAHVSSIAAVPTVRKWLRGRLREAGRERGLVTDGRDMGTVVFPDAELKVFLVADAEVRARRRLVQQGVEDPTIDQVRQEVDRLLERDRIDQTRETDPLLRAPDAVVLDTTALTFDEQVRAIARLARSRAKNGSNS